MSHKCFIFILFYFNFFHLYEYRDPLGAGVRGAPCLVCVAFISEAFCSVRLSGIRGLPQDMAVPSRYPRRDSPGKVYIFQWFSVFRAFIPAESDFIYVDYRYASNLYRHAF